MILDTSFIIDIMRKNEKAINKIKELISKGEPQLITAPTLFELYSGIVRSEKPEAEKHKVLTTLSNLIVLHLDSESAERGGEIDGRLSNQGEQIDPVDSMIAGITITKGDVLLTRNVKHFSRILGLKLESY